MGDKHNRRSAEEWAEFFKAYESSGLTQEEFCTREGLILSTFKAKLGKTPRASSFVELPSTRLSPSEEVRVDFPSGVRLTVRG